MCPLLIGINSIYVALRRHIHDVSFIVTAPLLTQMLLCMNKHGNVLLLLYLLAS